MISFKTYLKNFDAAQAQYWANYITGTSIFLSVLSILKIVIHVQQPPSVLYFSAMIIISFFCIFTWIKFGIALLKIKNDFIGLLQELGISSIYFPAIAILAMIILFIMNAYRGNYVGQILARSLLLAPSFVMTLIFYRAGNYLRRKSQPAYPPIKPGQQKII